MLFSRSHFQYLNYSGQFTVLFLKFLLFFESRWLQRHNQTFVDSRPPLARQRFVCTNQAVRKNKNHSYTRL